MEVIREDYPFDVEVGPAKGTLQLALPSLVPTEAFIERVMSAKPLSGALFYLARAPLDTKGVKKFKLVDPAKIMYDVANFEVPKQIKVRKLKPTSDEVQQVSKFAHMQNLTRL